MTPIDEFLDFDNEEYTAVDEKPRNRKTGIIYSWIKSPAYPDTANIDLSHFSFEHGQSTNQWDSETIVYRVKKFEKFWQEWENKYIVREEIEMLDDYWVEANPIDYETGLKSFERYKKTQRE